MKLKEILAKVRTEPRHLYWRWRLLSWPNPRGVSRQVLFNSLLMVSRAAPHLLLAPKIKGWSLKEARKWVSLLRGKDATETSWRRAEAYAQLPMAKKDAAGALKLARVEFDRLSTESKQAHATLWGRLLLETEPSEFENSIELILEGVKRSPRFGGVRAAISWSREKKLSRAARERIGRFIDEQPDNAIGPHDRIIRAEERGLAALNEMDLATAGAALTEMAKWAAFDSFPGNCMKLVDAAAKRGVLREERRAFLTSVLTREWRDWVRPEVEQRAAAV